MDEFQGNEPTPRTGRPLKFIIGGVVIVGAIIFLIISSLNASAQYFLTVDEVVSKSSLGELDGRNIRVSGAVLGETIAYDIDNLGLSFTIAHVPADNQLLADEGGLAQALHNAVTDSTRSQMEVVYTGPIPDLLQNEAQAILTGEVLPNGTFQADEILLKCPTKYEGSVPEQIELES
ncbi:MAG: cytochrome c maturation protein CcmE [Chloroflexi bacterium]|nr:cytochrome c maturation protein CcmE [Chloroflexota bacterium]